MSTARPSEKPVRIPGPDHPVTIERHPSRIVVKAGGTVNRPCRGEDLRIIFEAVFDTR